MGPNVVNLAERRKSKPVKPTVLELATFVCDDILDHWNKASSKNKLNEYFMVCTGWVAAFRVGSTTVATPFLTSETFVRCFNILLYLRLQRDLKSFDV